MYELLTVAPSATVTVTSLLSMDPMVMWSTVGLTVPEDSLRVTPVGRVIRRLNIDEMPQFFNVLKGDMSLVGTRPPTVDEFEQYESHHKRRLSMKPGITHQGSHDNLLGKNPATALEDHYSLDKQVTDKTPQAFLMLSTDDETVIPQNSIDYYMALNRHHVPASLHVYPMGGHGWGFGDGFPYKRQWTGELEKWLREGLTK